MREHRVLITAPVRRLVSLAEAKDHLRVDTTDEDAVIEALIDAAIEQVETVTRRAFVNRTYDLYLDGFSYCMELPAPPLVSVSSVKYTDEDGATQTVATSVYNADIRSLFGNVQLAESQAWPIVGSYPAPVQIQYVAGYGDNPEDSPNAARQAVLLLVDHWFENRGALAPIDLRPVPMAVDYLLAPLRVYSH